MQITEEKIKELIKGALEEFVNHLHILDTSVKVGVTENPDILFDILKTFCESRELSNETDTRWHQTLSRLRLFLDHPHHIVLTDEMINGLMRGVNVHLDMHGIRFIITGKSETITIQKQEFFQLEQYARMAGFTSEFTIKHGGDF